MEKNMAEGKPQTHFEVRHYVKVWGILVVLLAVSVLGPLMEIPLLMLITAFGIAIVKILMVAANFMHLKFEIRYIWFLLTAALLAMLVLFMGLLPDITKHEGANWENCMVTQSCVKQRM